MTSIVYIAAPYGADTPERRAWHVARACLLARFAVVSGYAPIVVHPAIELVFGDDGDESTRALGLECDLAMLGIVAETADSWLWALANDDGSLSAGVAAEYAAWRRHNLNSVRIDTWVGWCVGLIGAGLGTEWAALRNVP